MRIVTVVRRHRAVLLGLGTAVVLVGAVRASRQVVIPLWADHLGLDRATTSVVYGVSGLLDTLVDRRGTPCGPGAGGWLDGEPLRAWLGAIDAALRAAVEVPTETPADKG